MRHSPRHQATIDHQSVGRGLIGRIVGQNIAAYVVGVAGIVIVGLAFVLGRQVEVIGGTTEVILDTLKIVGGLLSTVSGTFVFGKVAAQKQFTSQMEMIRGQIAQATAQAARVVELARSENENVGTISIRIEQVSASLTMVIHAINQLTDRPFSAETEAILETKGVLAEVGNLLLLRGELEEAEESLEPEKQHLVTELNSKLERSLEAALAARPVAGTSSDGADEPSPTEALLRREAVLARIRGFNLQFVGAKLQTYILEQVFQVLSKNDTRYFTFAELVELLLGANLKQLSVSGVITRTKLRNILQILWRARVFNFRRGDEGPNGFSLKQGYKSFDAFVAAHDAMLIFSAEKLSFSDAEWGQLLHEDREFDFRLAKAKIPEIRGYFEESKNSAGGLRPSTNSNQAKLD